MKRVLLLALLLFVAPSAYGAAVTLGVSTASTANATTYASGAFTPAQGDILLVFVAASDTIDATAGMTSSVAGAFTKVTSALSRTSLDTTYAFVSNVKVNAVSQTVTFTCPGDAATGAVITVLRVSGIPQAGLLAVKQFAISQNQAAAGTPAITFGASVLTGNPTLVAVTNSTNPAAVTEPTGWTERSDTGYATPTTGHETASRDSGFTGTTVTWGSTSASAFSAIGVEMDPSACPTICEVQSQMTGAGSGTNMSLVFATALTAGNYVFVAAGTGSATWAPVGGDPNNLCGDTFTEATGSPVTGATSRIRVWWAKTAGGCGTINLNSTVSAAYDSVAIEYTGVASATPSDCGAGGTGTSTSLATGNCVTATANDILISFGFQNSSGAVYTAGSNYVMRWQQSGTGHSGMLEDRTVSATGTYTGTATSTVNAEWVIHVLGLKATSQPASAVAGQVGVFLVGP